MSVWQLQMALEKLAQGRFDKGNTAFVAKRLAESPTGEIRLMESICERENLRKALHWVEHSEGAPGVDGMKTTQLCGYLRRHWEKIKVSLRAGGYKPLSRPSHRQVPCVYHHQLPPTRFGHCPVIQVALFFKWIKQHLRIKAFYGTTENAVRIQIWVAIAVYVLIAVIRKRANLTHRPYAILQILSVTLFEKTPILQVFAQHQSTPEPLGMRDQLCLPGFLAGQE
jgi:hypothetical protein